MDNSTTESESDDSSSLESKQVQNGEDLERELRELFEYLDADRDSVLDKDEFERAFFELEIFLETSELDRLFKKYSSTVYPDGEVGVNYHHFRAVLRELTKRRETKKRSFLSARKLVRVLSRIGHMKNSLRDTIRTSIVKVMSPKRSSAKSKIKSKKSMWDVTSIEKDQLRLVFDHMDGDKSGDVNRVEMVRTLRHLGMYQSIGQIDNLFEKVTGSKNGKIRFEHFCELIMHTRTAHRTLVECSERVPHWRCVFDFLKYFEC
jgi:Ca2+-binding EF-hand superfamily protein